MMRDANLLVKKNFLTSLFPLSRLVVLIMLTIVLLAGNAQAAATQLTSGSDEDIQPDWHPINDTVVFASNRGGSYNIWKINTNGTGLTQLTNSAAKEWFPAWNHAGDKIAFIKVDPTEWPDDMFYLVVMNADGSNQTVLTLSPPGTAGWDFDTTGPVWSPTDDRIAFSSFGPAGGSKKVYLYHFADGSVTEITPTGEFNPNGDIYRLSWHGSSLAFDRYPMGIQTFQADGSGYQVLVETPEFQMGVPTQPAWSRNGARMAYCTGTGWEPSTGINVYEVNSGRTVRAYQSGANDLWPSWSPDGSSLVFSSNQSGTADLWITPYSSVISVPTLLLLD